MRIATERSREGRATAPGSVDGRGIVVGAASLHDTHGGGLNRFTEGLSRAMLSGYPGIRVLTASQRLAERYGEAVAPVRSPLVARSTAAGNLARMVWHQTVLAPTLRCDGAQVYFSTIAEGMLRPPCPQVMTVHDVIPLVYPELFARLDLVYRHLVPRLIRASAAVVTVSDATRRDLERFYPDEVADRPVHVVYQGYRSDIFRLLPEQRVREVRQRYGLQRYVLAVGETRSYKNIRRLVEAFAENRSPGVQLAVVGRGHKDDPQLGALPAALGIEDRVRFLGFVPDQDLAALYGGADAFVFPSMYEGFGIPLLEAMACGCPVVASSASAPPEVCGDAAVYVDPHRTGDIARGLAEVLEKEELRSTLRGRGLDRVKRFTYPAAAAQVMSILDGVRP